MKAFLCGVLGALFFAAALNAPHAYAQAMATGMSVDVLAALVGKGVVAATYTGTDGTGPVFVCNSTLDKCVKLGPGVHASIGTNSSGHILLGPQSDNSTIVEIGDGLLLQGGGVVHLTHGGLFLNGSYVANLLGDYGGAVPIEDSDGLEINGGTALKKRLLATATVDFGSIAAGATATLTTTVTGAAAGDRVVATRCAGLEADVGDLQAWVSAADTVSLQVRNHNGSGAVDPAACAFVIEVVK